jgi:hypothetical protein
MTRIFANPKLDWCSLSYVAIVTYSGTPIRTRKRTVYILQTLRNGCVATKMIRCRTNYIAGLPTGNDRFFSRDFPIRYCVYAMKDYILM